MKSLKVAVVCLPLFLGACSHIKVADVNLGGGVTAKAVRIPAGFNTPGMTALAVPNGQGGANVAAVGGNGVAGDLIQAAGSIIGGGLIASGSGATATANVTAVATAINN